MNPRVQRFSSPAHPPSPRTAQVSSCPALFAPWQSAPSALTSPRPLHTLHSAVVMNLRASSLPSPHSSLTAAPLPTDAPLTLHSAVVMNLRASSDIHVGNLGSLYMMCSYVAARDSCTFGRRGKAAQEARAQGSVLARRAASEGPLAALGRERSGVPCCLSGSSCLGIAGPAESPGTRHELCRVSRPSPAQRAGSPPAARSTGCPPPTRPPSQAYVGADKSKRARRGSNAPRWRPLESKAVPRWPLAAHPTLAQARTPCSRTCAV